MSSKEMIDYLKQKYGFNFPLKAKYKRNKNRIYFSGDFEDGEEIEVDMENATIKSQNGEEITFKKLPPFMLEILEQGGLIEYLKNKR